MKGSSAVVSMLAVLQLTGRCAAGEPLPSAASFSITYTFTTSTPATPVDIGNGRDLTVNRYLATFVNDEGKGFLDLAAGVCTNIRFTNRLERTVDTKGYCSFRDHDGDTLFAEYTTGTPKPSAVITHTWTLVSGTGKFDGIQGSGADTNSNNLSDHGSYQAVGKLKGSYRIVRSSAPAGKATRD